jgi:metal-responsive CopG/Arc/MetJ family transcriptional regulator
MAELARIGSASREDLLEEFDKLIAKRGYAHRSEAVSGSRQE